MLALSRRAFAGGAAALTAAACATPNDAPAAIERLSLNESSFGPSPRVAEAIRANLDQLERYVEAPEVNRLIETIALLERVSPDQIVLGEVLEPLGAHLAARSRGGEFIFSAPGYTALIDAGAPFGSVGRPVPLNAALENDLPALAAAVNATTLAVSLVNPHNPSGTVNDADAFDRFIEQTFARTLVIVDEAYLEYDDFARRSAIRFARTDANVLVFRTLAKVYGLAGISLGYAVAPVALAHDLRAAGIGSPHSLNRLALVAAEAALGDQAYVQSVATRVRNNRAQLHAALDGLGLQHTDSRANFLFFQSPTDAAAVRTALQTRGIIPGRAFPPLDQWIRITVGNETETRSTIAALRDIYA